MVNCGDNTQQTGADGLRYNYQEKANTKYKNCYPSKLNMESGKLCQMTQKVALVINAKTMSKMTMKNLMKLFNKCDGFSLKVTHIFSF